MAKNARHSFFAFIALGLGSEWCYQCLKEMRMAWLNCVRCCNLKWSLSCHVLDFKNQSLFCMKWSKLGLSFKIVVTYIKVKMCMCAHTHTHKGYLSSCTACRQHASWIVWRVASWAYSSPRVIQVSGAIAILGTDERRRVRGGNKVGQFWRMCENNICSVITHSITTRYVPLILQIGASHYALLISALLGVTHYVPLIFRRQA